MSYTPHEYLKKVLLSPVYDVAVHSDLVRLNKLSSQLENDIFLKREDQQPVKSFKLRGAYNKLSGLTQAQLDAGVVAASAGNHAQGVAYSAKRKGINATIVMPDTTPDIKVDAVRSFGGAHVNVVLHGSNFDQANEEAIRLATDEGMTLIPPFDDEDVIVGQGTIGRELLEQNPHLDTLFIAVGGGGLAAGVAYYLKQLKPELTIIAVESEDSACLQAALEAGHPVTLPSVGIFADGVAVKRMGEHTFALCQQYIDDVITVNSDEICAAIKDIFDDTRVIAEPAGALSVAGIRKYVAQHDTQGRVMGGILCGANINFHTLRYVSERCELGEQKEAVFSVTIPEKKGAFKAFCQALGGRVITEFNYRFSRDENAQIFVGIKLREGLQEFQVLHEQLHGLGYQPIDLTNNEMAKLHVRYMVGGRPPHQLRERIYRFEFPEHPGALMKFLNTLGEHWNITLFHYRNHGAAEGLVLAGFEVDAEQELSLLTHLDELGYVYLDETANPAYQSFLSHPA
ncbi:threonine ammonia-lyase, biosynthetic [Aestuariibacter sp. AA17]|uniref:L-threonine dehydratase n=1 Tax=Fluctibacter corallii TaxID=2984329 RepID=A0ABT3AB06_9ALTE|nr:threonine ammonia-lyase, biosynthetic [Aestuariibacter sp. AA17]MCV2885850.1 threonine ammonia-lyase, biosynthetic [Aestuariibacter sp. AA17]